MTQDPSTAFAKHTYISLTTFRRSGKAVATPVWFILEDGHLLVRTGASAGKVKRIRNSGKVTVAPCTARGKVTGAVVPAVATILPAESAPRIEKLLDQKYGLPKRLLDIALRIRATIRRRPLAPRAILQIDFDRGADQQSG